ncbi:MAG: bifunctional DNA-formamidopyrimidine glycosylase/DNA-(apurinic or apyrimidinic site) lyase [Terriglobales bacterium]
MPELPEVETVARGLRAVLQDLVLEDVVLYRASMLRGDPAALASLAGARVAKLERAGKCLILTMTRGSRRWHLLFHLGMTGQLVWLPVDAPMRPHTHAVLCFAGGRELRFRDPRRFGRLALAPAPAPGAATPYAPELAIPSGVEPLQVTAADFVARFARRQAPIKSALLNQALLRGIGNIYADESLFRAAIHPRARHVSAPRLRRLRLALREVLGEAIAAGGSSISDYVDSRGEPGSFHLRHRVYGREGQPCLRCRHRIRRIVLSGRSAHFCPNCQKP